MPRTGDPAYGHAPNGPERKYEDDALFSQALANPKTNHSELIRKTSARYQRIFRTRRDLAMAYFRKNPLRNVIERGCRPGRERLVRVLWSGDQFGTLELTTVRPLRDSYIAKKGCRSPDAGWYALAVEFGAELDKLEKLNDESEIDNQIG